MRAAEAGLRVVVVDRSGAVVRHDDDRVTRAGLREQPGDKAVDVLVVFGDHVAARLDDLWRGRRSDPALGLVVLPEVVLDRVDAPDVDHRQVPGALLHQVLGDRDAGRVDRVDVEGLVEVALAGVEEVVRPNAELLQLGRQLRGVDGGMLGRGGAWSAELLAQILWDEPIGDHDAVHGLDGPGDVPADYVRPAPGAARDRPQRLGMPEVAGDRHVVAVIARLDDEAVDPVLVGYLPGRNRRPDGRRDRRLHRAQRAAPPLRDELLEGREAAGVDERPHDRPGGRVDADQQDALAGRRRQALGSPSAGLEELRAGEREEAE